MNVGDAPVPSGLGFVDRDDVHEVLVDLHDEDRELGTDLPDRVVRVTARRVPVRAGELLGEPPLREPRFGETLAEAVEEVAGDPEGLGQAFGHGPEDLTEVGSTIAYGTIVNNAGIGKIDAAAGRLGVVPRNVLIAPLLGFRKDHDWARLERTINEADATRVRLLTLPPSQDSAPEVRDHIRAKLRDLQKRWPRFEWDERQVDLFSFEDCLQAFAQLFREEEGNSISVALGTSGSPGAVPSTIACLLWGGRGIYVGDADYEKPALVLPEWLSVRGPVSDEELRVLELVAATPEGLDKKTIVAKLKEMGRIREEQDKHAYRLVTMKLLPGLEKHGFVTVGPRDAFDGRHRFVVATEEGRRALSVLSPMLAASKTALHVRGRSRKLARQRL